MASPPRRVPGRRPGHAARCFRMPAGRIRSLELAAWLRVAAWTCVLAPLFLAAGARAMTIQARPTDASDDAAEAADGSVSLHGLSLVLGGTAGGSVAGIRWSALPVPAGANITAAWVEFVTWDSQGGPASFVLRAQAADSPPTFSTAAQDISTRPLTSAAANWTPMAWSPGTHQRTCDLRAVLQEVISRPGWGSGNALVVVVSGTGLRDAWSLDASVTGSPLLHVEYESVASGAGGVKAHKSTDRTQSGDAPAFESADTSTFVPPVDAPPVAGLTVAQLASPALTVSADGSTSTHADAFPIATYHFDFGDGSPVVDVSAPAAAAQHTYAAPGGYTVTLTVTDTGGLTSTPATSPITVAPPPDAPPVAGLTVVQTASPALTVKADGSTSTDTDAFPIATYHFDFGDGSPVVDAAAPTDTAQHTYAAAGSYTVTLTATDTGNLTSVPVTSPVNVNGAPVAHETVAQVASPALTARADATGSIDTDSFPIATYHFDFGDGSPVVDVAAPADTAQHTYARSGDYTVTLTATDAGNLTSAAVTTPITVNAAPVQVTFERRVAASVDDAEEFADSTVHLTSSDLELTHDGSDQTIGIRWTGVTIPPGSTITAAWIQFSAKESQNVATALSFHAEADDNPPSFTTVDRDVSSRPRTAAATTWAPVPWNAGEVGPNQRTPDLSAAIQEVVSRPGWAKGNALIIIVTGTGHRTAWAFDGNPSLAPLLHVEYRTIPPPERPPVARITLRQLAAPPFTVGADASASTDIDSTGIATYHFDFGDGSPVVDVNAPATVGQHTYAAAGTYTVTLTVTDTGNSTSAPVSDTISVLPSPPAKIAVYVGYYDTHHATNPKPKPDPWMGSPGVVFVGVPDDAKNNWDSCGLRVDNLTAGQLGNVVVTADLGSHHYALWGTNSIPVGYKLILAQTATQNFDGSDTNPAGCYGCDPSLCLTRRSSDIPVVHVSLGGPASDYLDVDQVLNTGGYDGGGCPYVGGPLPQTRYDESHPWEQIYSNAPLVVATATSATTANPPAPPEDGLPKTLSLSAPSPNPSHGALAIHFTLPTGSETWIGIYDLSGRLVHTCVDNELRAGIYSFQYDLSGVRPGVYFLRMWTPGGTLRQRFALTR